MQCSEVPYKVKSILIAPPSFLKAVHYVWTNNIEFVHLDTEELDYDQIPPKEETDSILTPNHENTTLEVTGSPLEVDLRGDESLLTMKKEPQHHWPEEESRYFPVDIRVARCYINQQMRKSKKNRAPLFVVCDGDNPQGTVLIGVHDTHKSTYTCLLNIVGCFPKDHEKLSLGDMEKSHRNLVRFRDCKINYLVHFKYFVFGGFLQNKKHNYGTEYPGSISFEITCNKKCHLDLPQNTPNVKKMVLQIIAGHEMSSVLFLWEDLCLLQSYLDILYSNDTDRLLSLAPLDAFEIFQNIRKIVGANVWKRETKMEFALESIRHETILDKLWNVLKYCEDLHTLRDAFHCLFEELAETESNLKIPESQTSDITTIINGIIDGKFAVPTLTIYQALEFLFEIGAEKLKSDYQSIMKHFYSTSHSTISARWSNLQTKMFVEDSNRKTRITVNLKAAKTDITSSVSKLAYLGKLQVATEFIYLVKNHVHLPEEAFDFFVDGVYKNYIDKDAPTDYFLDLRENPLCEFEAVINTANEAIIESELPVSWSLKMSSLVDDFEATTVYHLSKSPIVPSTIFNKYDITSVTDEEAMPYYVCKFESHNDIL